MITSNSPNCLYHTETPSSNTGLKRQTEQLQASVDYFQGTAHFLTLDEFQACARFIFNSAGHEIIWTPEKQMFSGIVWRCSAATVEGGRIGYNTFEDGKVHAWFSLPGSYFHSLSGYDQWFILSVISLQYQVKSTRIDLKVRDFTRIRTPEQILNYARQGHISGIRTYESASNGQVGDASTEAITTYLGSRKSEKFLRIYDAKIVHNVDAIDYELQCRDEKANEVYKQFVSIQDADFGNADIVATFIGKVVAGSVDFFEEIKSVRDESKLKLDRCNRMSWWETFRGMCGGAIKVSSGQKSTTISKTLAWIDKQVMVIMSALGQGFGIETFIGWLRDKMYAAKERFSQHHEHIADLCQNYQLPSSQTRTE